MRLRSAHQGDAAAISKLYAYWVLNGTGTFDEAPPPPEAIAERIETIAKNGLPWLVAEAHDGALMGYAYASPFRPRPGYRWCVEDSVYVAPDAHGQGLGRRLLQDVIAKSEAVGVRQMLAVIGDSANAGSIGLHRALGFAETGVLPNVGFKFGRWIDVVLMQRQLGPGATELPDRAGGWTL